MVVVGADVHKQTHTFVAVDEVGRQVGQLTAKATSEGHAKAWAWATREFGAELVWAIEDCRHLSARLERALLTAGQRVGAGAAEDDGRAASDRSHAWQVGPNRCACGRAGVLARAGASGGVA